MGRRGVEAGEYVHNMFNKILKELIKMFLKNTLGSKIADFFSPRVILYLKNTYEKLRNFSMDKWDKFNSIF